MTKLGGEVGGTQGCHGNLVLVQLGFLAFHSGMKRVEGRTPVIPLANLLQNLLGIVRWGHSQQPTEESTYLHYYLSVPRTPSSPPPTCTGDFAGLMTADGMSRVCSKGSYHGDHGNHSFILQSQHIVGYLRQHSLRITVAPLGVV